jgi:magnesium-transporting ATPase (P-type)
LRLCSCLWGSDVQDTIRDFQTHATEGLSSSALSALVARYGMNEFQIPPSEPLWLKMAKQVYEQPLILMLLASSVVSALFGSYDDAVCVLVAVAIVLTGESLRLLFGPRLTIQLPLSKSRGPRSR